MFASRLAALSVAFCIALPGNAAASLIWDIEVLGTHVQGTGRISLSGPSSVTSPDFEFDFSGTYSHNPWTLTESDVSAAWLVDATHDFVFFDLSTDDLIQTEIPGVLITFAIDGSGNDLFQATSFCFDTIREHPQALCHEDDFDFDQTEEVFFTAVHAIPEPDAVWLFMSGLGLLMLSWSRARDRATRLLPDGSSPRPEGPVSSRRHKIAVGQI